MTDLIFISPHLKKIGESYVLPNLAQADKGADLDIKFFNVCGEWDDLEVPGDRVIDNPFRYIVRLAPNLEKISPWLNYRVWLSFVSLSIILSLPFVLRKMDSPIVVARMATSAVALAARFSPSSTIFVASMAGVPRPSILRKWTWPWLYRAFTRIVVPCSTMIPCVVEYTDISASRIATIPNAVLPDDFDFEAYSFSPRSIRDEFTFLIVGRLTRQKGIDWLLHSLAALEGHAWKLLIAGDGEDHSSLAQLAEEIGISSQLTFLGRVEAPWENTPKFDLFLMPSRWEGPGHTIIEALARGIPSIVSDCDFGPSETAQDGDFAEVVPVDSIDELTAAIQRSIENYDEFCARAKKGQMQSSMYQPAAVYAKWTDLAAGIER